MRGLYSSKTEIRHKIFTEIARMAYERAISGGVEELPYKIVRRGCNLQRQYFSGAKQSLVSVCVWQWECR